MKKIIMTALTVFIVAGAAFFASPTAFAADVTFVNKSSEVTDAAENIEGAITKDKALEIALEHAGISEEETNLLKVKKDRFESKDIYEVDFLEGIYEYKYAVDMMTGEILSVKRA